MACLICSVGSAAFVSVGAASAAAVWAIPAYDIVVQWVSPDGHEVVYKDLDAPVYFSWSTSAGHRSWELIPGQDARPFSFSDDGTVVLLTLPDPLPATTRTAWVWTEGVGLTAGPPPLPSGGESLVDVSGDGTTILVSELVPGTSGDPDRRFVWTWSAAQGYTLAGEALGDVSSKWAWISDDGSAVLFYGEVAPDDFEVVRWTASGGAASLPGLDGDLKIWDFSGDGRTLLGSLDSAPLVWTVDSGIVDLGEIEAPYLTIPRFVDAISDDGATMSGEYLKWDGVNVESLPFRWSEQEGYTLVFDALADQRLDMRWPMGPLALVSDLSDDGTVSAGYADLNGGIDWYYMIYDLDPAQIPTETAILPVGPDPSADLLGLGLVNGGVYVHADELVAGGPFTASYRSLTNEELASFLPDAAALDALVGPQRAFDAWTFASTVALAPGSMLDLVFEYSSRVPDESALVLTAYVHDGVEWSTWPLTTNSPSADEARIELDIVPSAVVLAPPAVTPLPIGPLAAPMLALVLGASALRRLERRDVCVAARV